jgi:hypothetical protein
MITLICGSAENVYNSFGAPYFVKKSEQSDEHQIAIDLGRSQFLGTLEQFRQHLSTWTDFEQTPDGYFSQGNLDARNLAKTLLGEFPFKQEDESQEDYFLTKQSKEAETGFSSEIAFSYLDDLGNLCGLCLNYRLDDPSKWMFSLIKNTNLEPAKREVRIITSEKPQLKCDLIRTGVNPVELSKEQLKELVKNKVSYLLHDSNVYFIDLNFNCTLLPVSDFESLNALFPIEENRSESATKQDLEIIERLTHHNLEKEPLKCAVIEGNDNEAVQQFISTIKSPLALQFFQTALPPYGKHIIDPRCTVFNQISQSASEESFKENAALLQIVLNQIGASSDGLPVTMNDILNENKLMLQIGKAGATPSQIAAIIRKQGFNYSWIMEHPHASPATLRCLFLLDQWELNANEFEFLNHEGVVRVIAKLSIKPQNHEILNALIKDNINLEACMVALEAQGVVELLTKLYQTGYSTTQLRTILLNPNLTSAVRVLTRYKINLDLHYDLLSDECIQALLFTDQAIRDRNTDGTLPYDFASLAVSGVLNFYYGNKAPIEILHELLPLLTSEPISDVCRSNILSIATEIYIYLNAIRLAQALNLDPAFSQGNNDRANFLRHVIHALDHSFGLNASKPVRLVNRNAMLQSLLNEVFVYIHNAENVPVITSANLQKLISVVFECRKLGIINITFADLVQDPLLVDTVDILLTRFNNPERTNSLFHLANSGPETRASIASAFSKIREINPTKNPNQYYLRAISDSDPFNTLIFQILLPSASNQEDLDYIYDRVNSTSSYQDHQHYINRYLSEEVREAREQIISLADMLLELRTLGLNRDVIQAISKQDDFGNRFRSAVKEIRTQCLAIHTYLHDADPRGKFMAFASRQPNYKRDLYQTVYNQLTNPQHNFAETVVNLETDLKQNLDTDRHPILRTILQYLVNALIWLVGGGGYFNREHEVKTGDYSFFARPKSSETLRTMERQVVNIVTAPTA